MKLKKTLISERTLFIFSILIICTGIVLRVIFYWQNRCLIIDEANVARNIYERSFYGLLLPLNYEQYAPPVFLWVIKCVTLLFGYSEAAFRLFPLLCGITSLYLMFLVLKKIAGPRGMWYPLMIFATGFIYIRYSAELKQYMTDVVVVLALILLALSIDIFKWAGSRFFILWAAIGSITIWTSMPGVFMLAAVGIYYFYEMLRSKEYKKIWWLAGIALIWLLQFAAYYWLILRPQINSSYLQNFHKDNFLFLVPATGSEWKHNIDVLDQAFEVMGGKWALSVAFHLLTMTAGIVYLVKKERSKVILLAVPVICLLAAAALHQYALTPRLILFIMPLLLVLIGTGLTQLFRLSGIWASGLLIACAAVCIFNFSSFYLFNTRIDNEELTDNLKFLREAGIKGKDLCVHNAALPAYLYYTSIHPQHKQWGGLSGANFLHWNSNYDSLATAFSKRWALLYSYVPDEEFNNQQAALLKRWEQVGRNDAMGGRAIIYDRRK